MLRKIIRNRLKKSQGNNKIADMFRKYQVNKYGKYKYVKLFNDNRKCRNGHKTGKYLFINKKSGGIMEGVNK
ncbi:MAG: hypothetical protein LBL91_06165 [Lachnospiraceae bacterium]|jgi:hypothetical protein|nr:hypothetical protein [Lachnospiraceae bacterium]